MFSWYSALALMSLFRNAFAADSGIARMCVDRVVDWNQLSAVALPSKCHAFWRASRSARSWTRQSSRCFLPRLFFPWFQPFQDPPFPGPLLFMLWPYMVPDWWGREPSESDSPVWDPSIVFGEIGWQIEHLRSRAIVYRRAKRCSPSGHKRRAFFWSLGGRGFLAFRAHHVIGTFRLASAVGFIWTRDVPSCW